MPHTLWQNPYQTTIVQVLSNAVKKWPNKQAFDVVGEKVTYAELDRQILGLAHGLAAQGVRKGQTVVTMLDNTLDAIRMLHAITRLGAISVPVNNSYKGEFLRHQVVDAGAAIVIAESDYAERILEMQDALPDVKTLLYRGERPQKTPRIDLRPLDTIRTTFVDPIDAKVEPNDLAMLIYTSGTTGTSKGCMVSHSYACNFARLVMNGIELTEHDIMWTPTPLFHMNAVICVGIAPAMAGASAALYTRFSLSNFWNEIERTGATKISILGSMIAIVANGPETDAQKRCFGQINLALGAPFTEPLKKIWKERFGVVHVGTPGFGMTECCMMTYHPLSEPAPPGTSGRRFADFDIRITDEDGNECPPGVPGEIFVRPNMPGIMFQGYWRRAEASMQVMREFWFHTGDIGSIDADGFFSFVDRKKDYLRRGGENISSFEMESTFRGHPDILDVAVHAVKSDLLEDEVKVTAILHEGAKLTHEELCRWSLERVPYFAVPRYIEFRSDLPRTPTGRVQKFELREEGVTATTWDRAKSDIQLIKR